jgi:proline dehydrogenase
VLRRALLTVSRSSRVKGLVSTMPVSSGLVARFVAGEQVDDAVRATRELVDDGLLVSLDHLGEDTTDLAHAEAVRDAYLALLRALSDAGLTRGAEVSVKLSAVGQALPDDGEKLALEHVRAICNAARAAGTTVTLDMEDHTTTDSTLSILREVRQDFPDTGAVLQSYLHRTPPTAATSPTTGRACGCARAPTRSPSRSPTSPSRRSTSPTSAACASSWRAAATRWSPRTTRA